MSEWRKETSSDLADAKERINSLLNSISGELSAEQVRSVWRAYLNVEKSVAFVKFDLDEENPGRFIKLREYSVPDERQALQFALKNLAKGAESFELGDLRQALKELRQSRNYLRALLRQKRLMRAKRALPS
jgi:hypothetical protein